MPTETRAITFTNAEVRDAIAHFCVKTGRIATKSGVGALALSNEGGLSASFAPEPSGPKVIILESEIAAALLLHCKDRGIPIARRSIKSLQLAKDTVTLTLTMA